MCDPCHATARHQAVAAAIGHDASLPRQEDVTHEVSRYRRRGPVRRARSHGTGPPPCPNRQTAPLLLPLLLPSYPARRPLSSPPTLSLPQHHVPSRNNP